MQCWKSEEFSNELLLYKSGDFAILVGSVGCHPIIRYGAILTTELDYNGCSHFLPGSVYMDWYLFAQTCWHRTFNSALSACRPQCFFTCPCATSMLFMMLATWNVEVYLSICQSVSVCLSHCIRYVLHCNCRVMGF